MAANKQYGQAVELGREWFGGTIAELALQQTAMVPVETAAAPIVWQMGTVWGTVTAEIVMPINASAPQEQIH